jgi:hypothetical protein
MPFKNLPNPKKAIEHVRQTQKRIHIKVRQLAVEHFKRSFVQVGFEDQTIDKWKERNKAAKRNKGRAILVNKGFLKKGIVKAKNGFKIKVK